MYVLTSDPNVVFNAEAGSTVSINSSIEWEAYQQWLAAGNVPEPVPGPSFAD